MGNIREDITNYSDYELSLRIMNDENTYELTRKPYDLVKYVKENYIYTTKQIESLLLDCWSDYQDSIKHVDFY